MKAIEDVLGESTLALNMHRANLRRGWWRLTIADSGCVLQHKGLMRAAVRWNRFLISMGAESDLRPPVGRNPEVSALSLEAGYFVHLEVVHGSREQQGTSDTAAVAPQG